MISEELINNYNQAISQKYNAVCFDIDGTLTENNSTKIDERILPMLAELLKRHIPIVFITGRGETGLNDLKNEIVSSLKNQYNVTPKQILKMYALTNDGARIFMTRNENDTLFNVSEYISSIDDFNQLEQLRIDIINLLKYNNWENYFQITYSKDLETNYLINIRLIIKTQDIEIKRGIITQINSIIKNTGNNNINLTIGIHNGNDVLQIGAATKDMAIQVAERIIGIPQNSMLRIGDCGDENGNDYSMLNCPQGFSVNKTNNSNDGCFPILNNGIIEKGVNATLILIKQAKILPTICLEHALQDKYTKEYSKIEKQINKNKSKNISIFDSLVNKKFADLEKYDNLFDPNSGSIMIPMYDWETIPSENLLKRLWSTNDESSLCYAMRDDDNILLRGPQLYYYFLAHRFHDFQTKEDITYKDTVYEWFDNSLQFYSKVLIAINSGINVNDLNNVKMILGIIDNIRNNLLILLNQQIVSKNVDKNIIINLEKVDKNKTIYKIYANLLETENLMKNISFISDYKINLTNIDSLIRNVCLVTREAYEDFQKRNEDKNYSKEFRAYREIDNFAENFITCFLTMKNDIKIQDKGLCGLCYGGIELPIIMKSIDNRIQEISILKFNNIAAGYTKKQSLDLRFFDIFKSGDIDLVEVDKNKSYILLDDNLLTGKTMQIALTTFYDVGINVDKVIAVRYPKINRISQMFMPNHGALDYRHFFDFIDGLYFPSPYTWKDPFSKDLYEDSLGNFDLNRRKIIECIFKSGEYSTKSEISFEKRSRNYEK